MPRLRQAIHMAQEVGKRLGECEVLLQTLCFCEKAKVNQK